MSKIASAVRAELTGNQASTSAISWCEPAWCRRWLPGASFTQNKEPPSPDRWKIRSTTYHGIADAMAAQWGGDGYISRGV